MNAREGATAAKKRTEAGRVTHDEGAFRGSLGAGLFWQAWRPGRDPRAALAIVHGHGEHSGRYMNVVDALLPRGYAVYGFDHRGHGRSGGQRGHIDSWADYREDVRAFLRLLAAREAGRATFLMGHSMGALVVLDYLLHRSDGIRGAIISAPPLEPGGVAKPYLVFLSRVLSNVCPRFPLRLALDVSALSRDARVVRTYIADPLVHGRFTARWGTESLAAVARVKTRAADVKVPVLFIHGEADRLNAPAGSRDFFDGIRFADKTLLLYPEMFHELHNDIGYDRVVGDLEAWLARHL